MNVFQGVRQLDLDLVDVQSPRGILPGHRLGQSQSSSEIPGKIGIDVLNDPLLEQVEVVFSHVVDDVHHVFVELQLGPFEVHFGLFQIILQAVGLKEWLGVGEIVPVVVPHVRDTVIVDLVISIHPVVEREVPVGGVSKENQGLPNGEFSLPSPGVFLNDLVPL